MATLFPFQRRAVAELMRGKKIIVSSVGSGKSAMAMRFAEEKCKETGKRKVLVITTASKTRCRNANGDDDFTAEAKLFCSPSFCKSLSPSLSLISWHKLKAWVDANWSSLEEWVIIADEVQRCGSGVGSQMGRAFLKLAKRNPDWAGFTGTPGDTWLKYYPYFTAAGLVKNKTSFMAEFANVQTYKGYPEIVGWRNEEKLHDMWARISYAPDTSIVAQEMPEKSYKTNTFPKPKDYAKVLKTRLRAGSDGSNYDEDFLETAGALTAELRRVCFTKDKQQWVADFAEEANAGAVLFYNFTATGDKLEEILKKTLPKDAKIWRIDGKHHEIPTPETIGPRDMVLCQWQSGAEGLNLQMLHLWVGVELCYSYSVFTQAMGRIARVGQKSPMLFQILLTEGTIEQDILKVLRTKGEFSARHWCVENNIEVKEEK